MWSDVLSENSHVNPYRTLPGRPGRVYLSGHPGAACVDLGTARPVERALRPTPYGGMTLGRCTEYTLTLFRPQNDPVS